MNSPDPTVGRWKRPANAAPVAFAAALGLLLITACTTPSPSIVAPPDDTPPDTTPPGISLGHSHTTVLTPLTLTLTVVANDDTGVVRVAFFRLDDSGASPTPIGEASSAPYILELPLTARDNGVIRFMARAFDAAGNVGESDEVSVTVAIPVGGAPVFGGALYLVSATATLRDADLDDNDALAGGAIYNDGTLVLDGVRVADNRALGDGGGIYNGGALVVRSSSVVEGNRADAGGAGVGRGGGLFQEVGASAEGLGALTVGGNLPDDIHVEP